MSQYRYKPGEASRCKTCARRAEPGQPVGNGLCRYHLDVERFGEVYAALLAQRRLYTEEDSE